MNNSWINNTYIGSDGKQALIDLSVPENFNSKIIIFIHGFWGYKDWGCWNLVEDFFVEKNFGFCKYNITHGGTSINNPKVFDDLDSLSRNTYSKELFDLNCVINWIKEKIPSFHEIYLIGHSRGGGIALLTNQHPEVKKISTWAAISDIGKRFPASKELEEWKEAKVRYQKNGRTNQELPQSIDIYFDYLQNEDKLNIQKHCLENKIPIQVIHGSDDISVNISEGMELAKWLNTDLQIIKNSNHTFQPAEPWNKKEMPKELEQVCTFTLEFFEKDNGRKE